LAIDLIRVAAARDHDADLVERMNVEVRGLPGQEMDPQHHHLIIAKDGPVIGGLFDWHWHLFLRHGRQGQEAEDEKASQYAVHEILPREI
jgi:imidazolonepropionase-like amidohydrolase